MTKIYKYFSHDVMEVVFQRKGYCGIKCSFPKDYNDPYELFLGMDLNVPTDWLATYNDIVQDISQYPTSCFSKSPIVSPMWAHYAKDHSGFVLEFDVEELSKHFEGSAIHDVDYKDEPNRGIVDLLERASVIKKPRYVLMLHRAVFFEAYFSKYPAWGYEQESRFVDLRGYTENIGDDKILFIPAACVSAIIIGNKCPRKKISFSVKKAKAYGLAWYKLGIGKSYPVPYMNDKSNDAFIFSKEKIIAAKNLCKRCAEPLVKRKSLCPWCSITKVHKLTAAQGNPLRILDHFGALEQYVEGFDKIGR